MSNNQNTTQSSNRSKFRRTRNAAASMTNVMEFYDKVDRASGGDGLVWVKCVEPTGMQVVIDIKDQHGNSKVIKAIEQGPPRCLSSELSMEEIRKSGDISRSVFVGNLKLMTTAEVDEWYAMIEEETGLDTAEMEARVNNNARSITAPKLSKADESLKIKEAEEASFVEDDISPRVMYLMGEVDMRLKDSERRPAKEITAELVNIREILTLQELEYIFLRGYWPSVRSWAKKRIDEYYIKNTPTEDSE